MCSVMQCKVRSLNKGVCLETVLKNKIELEWWKSFAASKGVWVFLDGVARPVVWFLK